ncbi:Asp-tRNA(Asn)/Glu-tRNA(Gln) amidotransferase subunit GatA [Marinobacter lutaoensis]|jgi:aspartyl-tRNA(Asn)/glutamyl-tRNA(Gln) amidotransferase subunit A|uniref:Glutamyl-tRNA(Gln) amidotransferase subunit A n=1 Tax=Marinobacter lutaoensis TaxID=135739 RepID=A0A1V2DWQ7_9GAMM|nr:Asp-tRNA(Asn)/Glu-tRNA(Gln) amidotransferase subunit GatA [Marinobacter lutaoensis]MBI43275.1 Asp-tRNA(Asn)/Glu-tRNA(Gln) amidotransferase GatCAB subunit A [Oceanospirillales bacterium]NVD34944.1 Asp-tRNA(Asn)/Glu-tRNA(Gln) amidotransferase subunit GatA [Marinobacter lutaoensis]ONF44977.1 aspartyl/glutamyl-tRNA amidotransferase subunit A [Marinobacter lutaoensis]
MHEKTVAELSRELESGKISSVELTRHFLDRLKQEDGQYNSFITITEEQALAEARAADERRAAGQATPWTGIPFAHKDIFCTSGVRTTCGSRMLEHFVPPYDATVVAKFRQAGAVCLGKTNMDEFAMGSSNESSHFGPVTNPWGLTRGERRVAGGSSGGSAAAIAARLVPAATATDTGGSIRQPAALCGVTGIKPTYGRVSRYGMIAYASSLDQGGAMARTAEDTALMLNVMAGFDPKDSTSIDREVPDYTATLNEPLKGLRIGLPREYFSDQLSPEMATRIREAVREYEKLGATVREVSLPNASLAIAAYYVIAPAEASANLSRFDGVRYGYRCDHPKDLMDLYTRTRAEGFGTEVKRRILIGTYALSHGYYDAYYLKAQKVRRLIQQDFVNAFQEVDVLMGPISPSPAFIQGEKTDDPVTMYLEDIFTIAVNLAGLPAMSVPAGFIDGLPVGLQIIGNYFEEGRLLNAAHQFQQVTDWHLREPR